MEGGSVCAVVGAVDHLEPVDAALPGENAVALGNLVDPA